VSCAAVRLALLSRVVAFDEDRLSLRRSNVFWRWRIKIFK
jgi:hypothetical protein